MITNLDPLFNCAVLHRAWRPRSASPSADNIAFKIREIAKKHDIWIVENAAGPGLVRNRRYRRGDLVEHYHAAGEIIGYVMGLKRSFSGSR